MAEAPWMSDVASLKFPVSTKQLSAKELGTVSRLCIAALIGARVEDVPNFILNEKSWLSDAINWLWERGWGVLYVYHPAEKGIPDAAVYSTLPYIVTAKSPRGDFLHCCVYYHEKLIHDPHPDGKGIEGPVVDYILIYPKPDVIEVTT